MNDHAFPKGILEEALLQRLLHGFIDKIEKSRTRLTTKISEKTAPELFRFDLYDVTYLWMLIKSLENDYQVVNITLSRQGAGKEVYDGATLTFNRDKEALVRQWLQRPFALTEGERWQQALTGCSERFTPGQLVMLTDNRIKHEAKTEKEVLNALYCVGQELRQAPLPLSCRTLSARCFDGDSKFLDHRENFLRQLFVDVRHKIKPRPILLSVSIPPVIGNVLFIENQETFLECVAQRQHPKIHNSVLVFSAGFRGTAERIRNKGGVVFANINDASPHVKQEFEQWWYNEGQSWPCYFWGDLDYEGMRILSALRNTFPKLQAWRPGYEAMLRYYKQGVAHPPGAAKKESQKPLSTTGCQYADEILLPLLHDSQRFLDQEVIVSLED